MKRHIKMFTKEIVPGITMYFLGFEMPNGEIIVLRSYGNYRRGESIPFCTN